MAKSSSKTLTAPVRRKMYNRVKRAVAKTKKAKAKKNLDTFYLKARVSGTSTATQGVTVTNYLYSYYPIITATSVVGVTQLPEFIMYRNIYDRVRINSIRVTYVPKANQLPLNAAQNDAAYSLDGDNMLHTVIDTDSKAPSTISRLVKYNSYRKYSLLKKMSRFYSIKYPTGVWLDCQNIYEDESLLKRLGLTGGLTVYAENILEDKFELINEPLYDVFIEYGVVFQGRSEGAFVVDPITQAVTISPSKPATYAPETVLETRYGTLQDQRYDASGNLVPVNDTSPP